MFYLIAVILFIGLAIVIAINPFGNTSGVTKSTVDREKLDASYVQLSNDWIQDDIGWIRSESQVIKGLRAFYEKTGVQPYLVLTESVYGSTTPTGDQCWDYGNEIYDAKFADEGHMVFVFQCLDGGVDYTMAAVTGNQAKTVLDDEALEILYDYIDSRFSSNDTEDELFANAFSMAAERIMKVTPSALAQIAVPVAVVIGLIVAFLIIKSVFKRRKEAAAETQRLLETPIEEIPVQDDVLEKYRSDTSE